MLAMYRIRSMSNDCVQYSSRLFTLGLVSHQTFRYRGYSNVFVIYVFYFTSEVDNIYIS